MKKTKRIIIVLLLLALLCSCSNEKKIEMTKLTNEQFELFSQKFYSVNKMGSTYNLEEIKKKDICHKQDEICEQYFLMQMFYLKGLEKYISENLNLHTLENEIKNHSEHTIIPKEDREKYVFQMKSETDLSYIFIMNNIYIERLTDIEYALFKEKYMTDNIDDDFISFIEKTYQKITRAYEDEDKDVGLGYMGTQPMYTMKNKQLAIYLTWSPLPFERDKEGNYIYFEENQLIIEYMAKTAKEKSIEYSEKLGYPVEIVTAYGEVDDFQQKYSSIAIKKRRL